MIQLAIIAVLVVAAAIGGGGAVWHLQHQAVETCNADWKASIAEANLKLDKANEDKAAALAASEEAAAKRTAETQSKLAETEAELATERSKVPLSDPCSACRVPAARVRPAARTARSRSKTPYVIRHRQTVTDPATGPAVSGPTGFGVLNPGPGESSGLRETPKVAK
jgi:hypothetical protein